MSSILPPMQQADMPKREKAFWRMTGPGAILVGLSIGAGELMLWPWITAKFGAGMAWAAFLGVFLQMWINLEIGRWTIATGESPFTGFARQWRGFVYIFLAFSLILSLLPGWALNSGLALKALLLGPDHDSPGWLWTAITFAGIALVLFGPKAIYNAVEGVVSFLVVLIVVGLVVVMFQVGSMETFIDMGKGILNVGRIQTDEEFTYGRFFGAVVFAGAGGLGNLFYAFYLRDKGIGMGSRIPKLLNPIRGREEARTGIGYQFPEDAENQSRFRDWLNFVKIDQTLYFWLLNSFTMFLFMFGALAVLHAQGIVPNEGRIVWDVAVILEQSMGSFGRTLFLLIGMAALFSTQLTVVDGGARTIADVLHTNFAGLKRFSENKIYFWFALGPMVFGVASTWWLETQAVSAADFIFLNAIINGFAMAIYTPTILIVNLRFLPPSARPSWLSIVMIAIGTTLYGGYAIYVLMGYIQSQFG